MHLSKLCRCACCILYLYSYLGAGLEGLVVELCPKLLEGLALAQPHGGLYGLHQHRHVLGLGEVVEPHQGRILQHRGAL